MASTLPVKTPWLRRTSQSSAPGGRRAGILFLVAFLPVAAILVLLAAVVWIAVIPGQPNGLVHNGYSLAALKSVLASGATWSVFWSTAQFALVSTAVAMIIGVFFAWIAERTDVPHPNGLYLLMTGSLLIPAFFPAIGWILLVGPRVGIVNLWLNSVFGLSTDTVSMVSPVGMGILQGLLIVPLAFVIVGPALRSFGSQLLDAAAVHGLTSWRRFWRVEMPLITPALAAAAIFVFMVSVATFDIPAFVGMTYKVFTFSTYVYLLSNPQSGTTDYAQPAVLGLVMIVVGIALTLIYLRLTRSSRTYQVVSGRDAPAMRQPLGRWRKWSYAAIGLYVVLVLIVPLLLTIWAAFLPYFQSPSLAAIHSLTVSNFASLPWGLASRGLINTLILMAVVPLFAVGLGSVAAWVITRSGSRLRGLIDGALFLPLAVPGIVFAVALETLALFVVQPVFQLAGTVWILAIVYVLAFVNFPVRSMSVGMVQISTDIEEAGYVSGLSAPSVLRRLTLPLVREPARNAWLWISLLVFRELTMAVVLVSPSNLTLPTVVWSTWYDGNVGSSAAMSLLFMLVLLPLAIVYLRVARGRGGWSVLSVSSDQAALASEGIDA